MKKLLPFLLGLLVLFACDEVPETYGPYIPKQEFTVDGQSKSSRVSLYFTDDGKLEIEFNDFENFFNIIIDTLVLGEDLQLSEDSGRLAFYNEFNSLNNGASGQVRIEELDFFGAKLSGNLFLKDEQGNSKVIGFSSVQANLVDIPYYYQNYNYSIGSGTITQFATTEVEKVYCRSWSYTGDMPYDWQVSFYTGNLGGAYYRSGFLFYTVQGLTKGQTYQINKGHCGRLDYEGNSYNCISDFTVKVEDIRNTETHTIYDIQFSGEFQDLFTGERIMLNLYLSQYLINY